MASSWRDHDKTTMEEKELPKSNNDEPEIPQQVSISIYNISRKKNKYLFSFTAPHERWFSAFKFVVDIHPQIFSTRLGGFLGFSNRSVDFSFTLFVE